MNNTISNVLTGVLVLCALVVTGLVVRSEFLGRERSAAPEPEVQMVEEWQSVAANGHVRGPANAPVKIVEFSDFQCPFCARMPPALAEIRARYPEEVATVYRHLPLDMHDQAFAAAVASECAARQNRFWAYHDALFANQERLAAAPWDSLATATGIPDMEIFRRCVEQESTAGEVKSDKRRALNLGIGGTPAVIVNGRMVEGALPVQELDRLVQKALAREE